MRDPAPTEFGDLVGLCAARLQPLFDEPSGPLRLLGICGAQGSGKTTLAAALARRCDREGIATAVMSLDDLYLTRADREKLGRTVHPLLRTRGVPGTHDVGLGLDVVARLSAGEGARLPRFDKATDDRMPEDCWPLAPSETRLLILEGWCVGARPQADACLGPPINRLEREKDGDGIWRHYVNEALAGSYQALFGRIDLLGLLAAPGWDVVPTWRAEQEAQLRREKGRNVGMTDEQIGGFVQHYERLTRWILQEMPERADLVVRLRQDRSVQAVS